MRVIKKQNYLIQKPVVERMLNNNPDKDPYSLSGVIAVATGCHILVICEFIGELKGFSPQLVDKMERLRKFYNVEKVI